MASLFYSAANATMMVTAAAPKAMAARVAAVLVS
jgi:hypothetical protein